jgi:hypothetical protein
MSSSTEITNVTTKVTSKTVTTTDADGWTSVKKVHREPKADKPKFYQKNKSGKDKQSKPVETKETKETKETPKVDDNSTPASAETPEIKAVEGVKLPPVNALPAKLSNGKGYLSAVTGVVTPVKVVVTATPVAPVKKSNDAASVASDSSDESSHPGSPRRLSFSEAAPAAVKPEVKRIAKASVTRGTPSKDNGSKPRSNTTKTPYVKRTDDEHKPRPKRTEQENKSHNEYVAALRKAEDDFLRECLPSDKERVSKVAFELEKIRNHSATVHEVSFAKDFDPVTVGDKPVSFSREKFARNSFFIKRLKKEYYSLFPACEWISIKESTRADKPDTLFVRVGNRE